MQRTIAAPVQVSGVGIHTGCAVTVTLRPAPVDGGVTFVRTDIAGALPVRLSQAEVLSPAQSPRRTSVSQNGVRVETVEHLLSALSGCGIDNIEIALTAQELPGLDGSSRCYIELLDRAGIVTQDAADRCFSIPHPIYCQEGKGLIVAVPAADFRISYTLQFDYPYIPMQHVDQIITPDYFRNSLAYARTFCIEEEVKDLMQEGLGRGASYENTLVIGADGHVIKNTLRASDELARHKVLDLIGDLYLAGTRLKAHIIAVRSGHSLNIKMAQKIREVINQVQDVPRLLDPAQPSPRPPFGVQTIKQILPHRYPFLFVDEILSIEGDTRAVGVKYLSMDDYFFKGHFPGHPVTPGVLIMEALAQVGGVLFLNKPENRGKIVYFMCIDEAKFRKPVLPGDKLFLEIEVTRMKSRVGQMHGVARVGDQVVAEGDLKFSIAEV